MAFEAPDDQIYCKVCYRDRFGDGKTPLTYTDVSQIKMAENNEGCLRCKGVVFEAEKVIVGEQIMFHKNCFNCLKCKGSLNILKLNIAQGGEVFCKACYKIYLEENKLTANTMTDTIKADAEDRRGCPRCGGKVFEAEKVPTKSNWFHKSCFSCATCKVKLDSTNFVDGPKNEIFCKNCLVKHLPPGGRNKSGDKP